MSVVSGPTDAPAPTVVSPRRCVLGSITLSPPSATVTSIQVVAGSTMVTPARIHSVLTRSRRIARSPASSTRSLHPSTSVGSPVAWASTTRPESTSRPITSVRYSSPCSLWVVSLPSACASSAASNAYRPALISVIARCSDVASRSSTIASTAPVCRSRMMRPSPYGSATSAVSTVAAAPAASCASTRSASVRDRSSGTSPLTMTTVPSVTRTASSATRTA